MDASFLNDMSKNLDDVWLKSSTYLYINSDEPLTPAGATRLAELITTRLTKLNTLNSMIKFLNLQNLPHSDLSRFSVLQ